MSHIYPTPTGYVNQNFTTAPQQRSWHHRHTTSRRNQSLAAMYGVPWIPPRKKTYFVSIFFYHIYIYTHGSPMGWNGNSANAILFGSSIWEKTVARNATDRTETQYRHGARGHGSLSLLSFGLGFPTWVRLNEFTVLMPQRHGSNGRPCTFCKIQVVVFQELYTHHDPTPVD